MVLVVSIGRYPLNLLVKTQKARHLHRKMEGKQRPDRIPKMRTGLPNWLLRPTCLLARHLLKMTETEPLSDRVSGSASAPGRFSVLEVRLDWE